MGLVMMVSMATRILTMVVTTSVATQMEMETLTVAAMVVAEGNADNNGSVHLSSM